MSEPNAQPDSSSRQSLAGKNLVASSEASRQVAASLESVEGAQARSLQLSE